MGAAETLRTAADGVIVSAQGIMNTVSVALGAHDDALCREANRKIAAQMKELRAWVRIIRESGTLNDQK